MLKFIRGKGTHLSAERIKIQKELYGYRKVCLQIEYNLADSNC